jgi:NhaP-type Na+/H+ or K+/H+ antiporter
LLLAISTFPLNWEPARIDQQRLILAFFVPPLVFEGAAGLETLQANRADLVNGVFGVVFATFIVSGVVSSISYEANLNLHSPS